MSAAFIEREFMCGFRSSSSFVTSDANPAAGPTFFFAISTALFACSSSSIVYCFAIVSILSAGSTALLARVCLARAESSHAPTGAAFGIGVVEVSVCFVGSVRLGLLFRITVS